MSANSLPRKIVKKLLVPFPRLREYLQTIAMAKDIYTNEWAIKNEPEIFWIKSILKSGDVAIDVGANYGLYTYNLSNAVGDNGFVYYPIFQLNNGKTMGEYVEKKHEISHRGLAVKSLLEAM